MIKSNLFTNYTFQPLDLILGSYHFDDTIAIAQKNGVMWFDHNLQLIKQNKRKNKLLHPIDKYKTLEISHQNSLGFYENGKLIKELDQYQKQINGCLQTLGDNLYLLSSIGDQMKLFYFNHDTLEYSKVCQFKQSHSRLTYSAKKMNNYLASCSTDRTVKIFDIQEASLINDLKFQGFCYDITFKTQNSFFVCGQFNYILLYDLRINKYQSKIYTGSQITTSFGKYNNQYLISAHNNSFATLDLKNLLFKHTNFELNQKIWDIIRIKQNKVLVTGGVFLGIVQVQE